MTARKVKKQPSRDSRTNISHTLESKRLKQLTIIQLHANIHQQKSIYYNRVASKLVKFKKSRETPAVTRESTKSHHRELQDQNKKPAY